MREIHVLENVRTENLIVITIENEELFKEEVESYLSSGGYLGYSDLEELNFDGCSVINYEFTQDNYQESQEEFSDILYKQFGIK